MRYVLPLLALVMLAPSAFAWNLNWKHPFDLGEEEAVKPSQPVAVPAPPPLPAPVPYKKAHKPMIAIVIDDMGLDVKRSAWAADLPAEVTLSYLPYARNVQKQVDAAKGKGHEIILHMPMEPRAASENPGPHHLSVGMSAEEIEKNTAASLDAFTGYTGVNNHMGSKFTAARPGMEIFMAALAKRNVYFLDSKTSPRSLGEEVARAHGITATHRDVFLDHTETAAFVAAALNHTEDIAVATGAAIAIGHPKDVTLASLEEWLPTLKARGVEIVPLGEVVKYRNSQRPAENAGFSLH